MFFKERSVNNAFLINLLTPRLTHKLTTVDPFYGIALVLWLHSIFRLQMAYSMHKLHEVRVFAKTLWTIRCLCYPGCLRFAAPSITLPGLPLHSSQDL